MFLTEKLALTIGMPTVPSGLPATLFVLLAAPLDALGSFGGEIVGTPPTIGL